ncbi:adhesion G protein-coupled receptor E2-like [Acropora muricata]|uniref:adhesion G protein-coupled receptor E2-like n=1 Tax=Acropora muricata TaxID=159855 RepID=UPI0034E433DA
MEKGFRGLVCKDINECKENKKLCSGKHMSCNNKVGRYECVCKNNLRLNWEEKCIPLTKCDSRGEHCPYGSHCKEIALDSYRCVCNAGFKPVEVGEKLQTCEDLNECLTGKSNCSADRCRNTVGSYTCIHCLPGFIESKQGHCIGKMSESTCHCDLKTEYCKNRRCVCKVGYKRNTEGHCILPPDRRPKDKQKLSAHSPLRSHVSVLPCGLVLYLILTTTATSSSFPHGDFSHVV